MGSERLIWGAKHNFPGILLFPWNRHGLYSLGIWDDWIITLRDVLSNGLSSINTKTETKFELFQRNPYFDKWHCQDTANFSAVRSLKFEDCFYLICSCLYKAFPLPFQYRWDRYTRTNEWKSLFNVE